MSHRGSSTTTEFPPLVWTRSASFRLFSTSLNGRLRTTTAIRGRLRGGGGEELPAQRPEIAGPPPGATEGCADAGTPGIALSPLGWRAQQRVTQHE